jgi:hypothetical protein
MNRSVPSAIPALRSATSGAAWTAVIPLAGALLGGLLASPASAAPPEAPMRVAAIVPQAGGATPGDTSAVAATAGERPSDFGGSVTAELSLGLGTFAPAPHQQALLSTTLLGSAFYRISDEMRLTLAGSVTSYNINDFNTPLPQGEALPSDLSVGVSHSRIYRHEGSGLNVSGAFRVLLPTSPGSRFQNRWFTLMPSLNTSLPIGPVSLSWSFGFGKFFGGTSTATVDCSDFEDPEQCYQGRGANTVLGYETERRGGEVFIPGVGMNSFFFSNTLAASWSPVARLSLSLSFGVFTYFGLRSLPEDEFSSQYAVGGRAQRDRLISSFIASYQVLDAWSFSAGLITDAGQPFGARGDSAPVVFDLTRAADNITSLSFGLTTSF